MDGFAELLPLIRVAGELGIGVVMAGVVVFVLVWTLKVAMPALTAQHIAQLTAMEARYQAVVKTKDDQIKELIDGKDGQGKEMLDLLTRTVNKLNEQNNTTALEKDRSRRADFREALASILDNCRREHEQAYALLKGELGQQTAAILNVMRGLEEFREAYLAGDISRRRPRRAPEEQPPPEGK
jgi:hypothetical protein